MLEENAIARMESYFGKIGDPRKGNAKRRKLLVILIIAICAVICGADSWSEIELFGKNKRAWLKTFLGLPNGIPYATGERSCSV